MAIENKSVKVVFGTGDIGVGIGYHSSLKSGAVQFYEIPQRPIGEKFNNDKKVMDLDEGPVTFVFNKIESLDAVIYQLEKLKEIMENDGVI